MIEHNKDLPEASEGKVPGDYFIKSKLRLNGLSTGEIAQVFAAIESFPSGLFYDPIEGLLSLRRGNFLWRPPFLSSEELPIKMMKAFHCSEGREYRFGDGTFCYCWPNFDLSKMES